MRIILFIMAIAAMTAPAWAMKTTATIASDEVVEIAKIIRGGSRENDEYKACTNIYGDFGSGTVTLKVSTDDGTTKSGLKYSSSGGFVDFTATDDTNLCFSWGFGTGLDDDTLFYASMSGSTSPSVTIDTFDNR